MLRSANELLGYNVTTRDGESGHVRDLLFDDKSRIVRYLVVRTGSWLTGDEVLISPVSVRTADHQTRTIETVLTTEKIRSAPGIETDRPVSRQQEEALVTYYHWPTYWAPIALPDVPTPPPAGTNNGESGHREAWDSHLRSVSEVTGYSIECIGDRIGHVEDLIADTDSWVIRYLVIDTRDWLPGKKVIVSCEWLTEVRWNDRMVHVDLTKKQIETAPPFDPRTPVNREYETRLYDFYGRPTYW